MAKILKAANFYAKQRFAVFPLPSNSQVPPENGPTYQQASFDLEQVEKWFRDEDCNIGLATGKVSQLLVVEVDGTTSKLGFENLENLKTKTGIDLNTWAVNTPNGGKHFYFSTRLNRFSVTSGRDLVTGINWYANDSFVVAAPSTINDVLYKHEGKPKIFADCPQALIDLIVGKIKERIFIDTTDMNSAANTCVELLRNHDLYFTNRLQTHLVALKEDFSGFFNLKVGDVQYALNFLANFLDSQGKVINCPLSLARMLLLPTFVAQFKIVKGLTCLPILRDDSSILFVNGYDEFSEYYFDSATSYKNPVKNPTDQQLKEALTTVFEAFNFSQLDASSRANLLCCLLSILAFHVVKKIPLFLVQCADIRKANLLAQSLLFLAEQREDMLVFSGSRAQLNKDILAHLSKNSLAVVLNNCEADDLQGSGFSAITSGFLQGQACKIIALITSEKNLAANPRFRDAFKIVQSNSQEIQPNLLEHTKKKREKIILALFTLLCGFKNIEWPPPPVSSLNYSDFDKQVCQVVLWLRGKLADWQLENYALDNPLQSFANNFQQNTTVIKMTALFTVLYRLFGTSDFTSNKIFKHIEDQPEDQSLQTALVDCLDTSNINSTKIGKYFAEHCQDVACKIVDHAGQEITATFLISSKKTENKRWYRFSVAEKTELV